MPSVFPADAEEIRHKCRFVAEVLSAMGLPIIENEMYERAERILSSYKEGRKEKWEVMSLQKHIAFKGWLSISPAMFLFLAGKITIQDLQR